MCVVNTLHMKMRIKCSFNARHANILNAATMPYEASVMTQPAMSTPINAERSAFQNFISIVAATSEPVHAPVAGRGMATKSATPQKEYLSIFARFFSAFRLTQPATLAKNFTLDAAIQSRTLRTKSRIIGTGTILPITLMI